MSGRIVGEVLDNAPLRALDWYIAVAASTLHPAVKITAMTLPGRTGRGGGLTGRGVQPVPDATAAILGIGRRTVDRHIAHLVEAGYLHQTRRASPQGPAEYTLTGPPQYAGTARKTHATDTPDRGARTHATDTPTNGTRPELSTTPTHATDTPNRGARPDPTCAKSGGVRAPQPDSPVAHPDQQSNSYPTHNRPPRAPARPRAQGADQQLRAQLHDLGVPDHAEQTWILDRLHTDPATRDPARRLTTPWLHDARHDYQAAGRTHTRTLIRELRTKPPCQHGDPGGDQPHPTTGQPLCPQCRAAD